MPLQRRDHNKIKRVKNKEIPELSALKIPYFLIQKLFIFTPSQWSWQKLECIDRSGFGKKLISVFSPLSHPLEPKQPRDFKSAAFL